MAPTRQPGDRVALLMPNCLPFPVAFIVPSRPDVRADDVPAAVNDQVVPYKRLREVIVVDRIPVSAAGKILKRELRERLDP